MSGRSGQECPLSTSDANLNGSLFHPLEHLVVLAVHSQPRVDLLGALVAAVDVEADAADAAVAIGQAPDVVVKSGVHALPASLRADIDALNPPHHAVTPVAPLVRDQERSHD